MYIVANDSASFYMWFVAGSVSGFTFLDNRLYVVCHCKIHVFPADTFSEISAITVDGLQYPADIVACHDDCQLYVSDLGRSIWRVSAANPTDYEEWLMDESFNGFSTLSLTSRRLLMTTMMLYTALWARSSLRQYSTVNKELLRVVELSDLLKTPTHAVETSHGTFVISHTGPSAVSELFSFIICLLVLYL